jgi:hypothetical protein
MQEKPSSPYSRIRVRAYTTWRGPRDIVAQNINGETFYGWPVLSLEASSGQGDSIESRSVYANPYDSSQRSAILRAVIWNGARAKLLVRGTQEEPDWALPARFVIISRRQLMTWLSVFEGSSVHITSKPYDDFHAGIKRLRIEYNYQSQVFEVIWRRGSEQCRDIENRWTNIWRRMTLSLKRNVQTSELDEDYWVNANNLQYDFASYQPDLFS